MENTLVSAIITTYGRPFSLVKRAIDSVLHQTYPHIELILVDDNGKNSSLHAKLLHQVKATFGDHVKYLSNTHNQGGQFSRNRGFWESRGEFVAFLDDDDVWLPNKIATQLQFFTNQDIGLVSCWGRKIISQNNKPPKVETYNYHFGSDTTDVSFDDLMFINYIGGTSRPLIRRGVFAKSGLFRDGLLAFQDYELWLRVSRQYRCVIVPRFLVDHYWHDGHQISKDHYKRFCGQRYIYRQYGHETTLTCKWYQIHRLRYEARQSQLGLRTDIKYYLWDRLSLIRACLFDTAELRQRLNLKKHGKKGNR